jgi:arginase family enzyme
MEAVYLHSGTEEAKTVVHMLKRAKILGLKQKVYSIGDDIDLTGKRPIMICADGKEHGYSLDLTEKIVATGQKIDKVGFDAHEDFTEESEDDRARYGYDIGKETHYFSSHNLELLRSGYCSEIQFFGCNTNRFVDSKNKYEHGKWIKKNKSKIMFSRKLDGIDEIRDKTLHVSVDLDVLDDTPYVNLTWSIDGVVQYDDFISKLRTLQQNNNIIGVDICGFNVADEEIMLNLPAVRLAMKHYGDIISMFS